MAERPPAPTVREFAETFLACCRADRLARNTLTAYDVHLRVHILPVLAERRLDAISQRDLVALKNRLVDRKQSTAAEILKTLKCMLNRAVKLGALDRLPVEVDVPRRVRGEPVAYTPRETAALVEAATNEGPMALAAVLLGLDGGLRRGEILALQWADVDLERRTLTVRRTLVQGELGTTTKGHSEETIGLTRRLVAALANTPRQGPFVLMTDKGGHWKEARMAKLIRRLARRAEIRELGTHVLRRTCATRIADNGGGVTAVAAQLRHRGLQMATRYVERRASASEHALRALEK